MGKHTLQVEYDYDFILIGIASHEKDYRLCWAVNNQLEFELAKGDSLEIKGKRQATPSFFSLYTYENQEDLIEYSVLANMSESKVTKQKTPSLFDDEENSPGKEWLIPEYKQMNYLMVIRGEVDAKKVSEIVKKIQAIDLVQAAVNLNVDQLKSKQNLIF